MNLPVFNQAITKPPIMEASYFCPRISPPSPTHQDATTRSRKLNIPTTYVINASGTNAPAMLDFSFDLDRKLILIYSLFKFSKFIFRIVDRICLSPCNHSEFCKIRDPMRNFQSENGEKHVLFNPTLQPICRNGLRLL
jgi:hypothetical protein